ncbi:MAG: M48 family metallopeptidase [Flavobacteriales bacterium]|nr:M48 family metallopeptidase [Flavobacteriales bacterium]MDG1779970.1 M48 family metallopeptidase [Flavobacteriales bacterium]MDG2246643.1 M48 family metallopeptidase [Flavobacteriales bacterium]
MKTTRVLFFLTLVAVVIGCSRIPISGRRQVNLLPESQMIGMSQQAYTDFLTASTPVTSSDRDAQMVKEVGEKIAVAVEQYLAENGQSKRVEGFDWEFQLVDDPTVNAWCMPGGKVVFYTGILPICQDEKGLAVVMGHEIAHAVARHGNERMSQQLLIQAGGVTLAALISEKPQAAQNLFLTSYGVGSQLGSLSFSRQHESESDKLGLVFMAMAGYNPAEAPLFWERMAANGGAQPPEFLSTHPNHDTRINDLNEFMPEALKYYTPGN